MKRIVLIVALCLLANVSFAEFISGNKLYGALQDCEKYENGKATFDNYWSCGFSNGYITGAYDAYVDTEICEPSNATTVQTKDIVHLWLKNNPDKRSYSADSLVLVALRSVWPCPE